MNLSENLQFLRAWAGLTQEQLAEKLGVTRQSVSKWESGASYPEMDTILKLCGMFQTDLDTLLRGSVERSLSQDSAGYDRFMTLYARKVAGAVSGIIAGVALMLLLYGRGLPELLSGAVFLLVVTVSVIVMIASGMEEENFRRQYPTIPDFYTDEQKSGFRRRFIWHIAGGVGAILFGVVLTALASAVLPEEEPYEALIGAVFLLIVAGAVFSLIYGGMLEDKYDIPKYNRQNNPTAEEKALRRRAKTACALVMILATALFLFLGLTRNNWESAAVIYPVGGVLCGGLWVLLGPRSEE